MIMQLTWTAEEIIRAVHGECLHEQSWAAHGIVTDLRRVKPGDLFVALQDSINDGHNDISNVFAAGAVAAIVSKQVMAPPHAPQILVADTFRALEELGRAGRERSSARIIAVTGSNKSGCKDMLRLMLNEVGETYADEERLNDRGGVPLSLARLPQTALYGVFEIGANSGRNTGTLSQQIAPNVMIVTASENHHIDYFDLPDGIEDASLGLFAGVKPDGTVILNRDDDAFTSLAVKAKAQGMKKILSFGGGSKTDARLIDCIESNDGSGVVADIFGRRIRYRLGTPGVEAAMHSLGGLLAAVSAGADMKACAAVLEHYRRPKEPHNVIRTITLPQGAFTLIDESRDANPFAVHFAIRVLGQMQPLSGGRRILVLGDMEGLAEGSPSLHADLAQDIAEAGIDLVFCCGEMTGHLFKSLPEEMRGFHAADSHELARHVARAVRPADIVTVKGALGMHMSAVIEALEILGMPGIDKRLAS